jgi:hypothetical protein
MVALASSVIAGAPAQAAGEVVFAPTTGTSYNTLVTEQISLNASLAPGQVAGNISQLKYKVDSAVANSVWINTGNTVVTPVVGGVASTTSFVVAATGASSTSPNIITLKLATSAAATATTSVTVTAFLDSNSDNLLTAGEFEQARTVKFVKYSEVVPTVAFSSTPSVGDSTLKSTVALADINVQQLTAASYLAAFTATTVSGGTAFTAVADVQVASGAATSAPLSRTLVAGDVVTVQAKYGTELLGTAVSVTVSARTITVPVVADITAVSSSNATGLFARTNSAFAVALLVKGTETTPVAKAGVVTSVAITSSVAPTASKTLSVNGTVSNNTVALPTALAVTTDASGNAVVNLIPTGFAAGDTFTVAYTVQNTTVSKTFTLADAAFTLADSQDDTASANRAVARGGSVSFTLEVKDQFGSEITGAARIATTVSGGTTIATAYTALAAGKATVTVKDGQTTTSNPNTVTFALETQNASTLNWAVSNISGFGGAAAPTSTASKAVTVAVSATAPGFATAPAPVSPATKFTGTVTPDAYTATAPTNGVSVLGNGSALATSVAGQRVTVAGAGELFLVNGKYYKDTVTFFSGAAGAFAVTAFSQTAGDQVVTFTTGTTTVSVTITYAAGPVALVSLAAPAQAQVGQALDVVITTTDKWGNAQASVVGTGAGSLSVSSTGTGYFASTAPVTNAAGKATVKYIVGTADIGTAFLSATLELGTTDATAARSIEFGLTDGDVVAGGKRVFVSAEFAKGRTVSVSINGKRIYSKVQTTDNAVELAFTQRKAGTYTVTVRISGGITFTEKVTVG